MKNINKSMKSLNDERLTPPILVEPILNFVPKGKVIWCPFDKGTSEFVRAFRKRGDIVIAGHIENGKDFFSTNQNPMITS